MPRKVSINKDIRAVPKVFGLSLVFFILQFLVFGVSALVFLLNATIIKIAACGLLNGTAYILFSRMSNKGHQQRILLSPDIKLRMDTRQFINYGSSALQR